MLVHHTGAGQKCEPKQTWFPFPHLFLRSLWLALNYCSRDGTALSNSASYLETECLYFVPDAFLHRQSLAWLCISELGARSRPLPTIYFDVLIIFIVWMGAFAGVSYTSCSFRRRSAVLWGGVQVVSSVQFAFLVLYSLSWATVIFHLQNGWLGPSAYMGASL